jgi:hypothetical protein
MNTAHFLVDDDLMAVAIRASALAQTQAITLLTNAALRQLESELGGMQLVVIWLSELANEAGKPVGLNLVVDDDHSQTVFLPPVGWSAEKLQAWVAARHEELEAEFGEIGEIRRLR